ncbi:MAG TPA: NADH:ubiquinone oxidoreductase [Planctomycetota bacterium]|nr:NADH:ubiquinone oxidoreductase [Planctomycetota bacterium]
MKPKVAFFDFTSCEGCQLQQLNCEDELLGILAAVEVVNFREATSVRRDDYDIAFIEGSISTPSCVERIRKIRENAKVLVTLGACASTGGLNMLKNFQPLDKVRTYVYGDKAGYFDTLPVRPVDQVVKVDYKVHGCPMDKQDYLETVKALLSGREPRQVKYPVCVECKMKENACRYDYGETCLGPVTRAGCGARCPSNNYICFGCRGLVDSPKTDAANDVLKERGLSAQDVLKKYRLFYGYSEVAE